MKTFSILAAAALFGAVVADQTALSCYSSVPQGSTFNNLTNPDGTSPNSRGWCGTRVCKSSVAIALTDFNICYCVDELPPASAKIDMSNCNLKCPGFPDDICGGSKAFLFYDNGIAASIPTATAVSSSSTSSTVSSTTSTKPSATRTPAETSSVTSNTPTQSAAPSKPNTAGIAAGVVIGVVVIAGIMGGLFFFMKQRKKRALEEEHRRNAEASAAKPPSYNANPFDTRLDPVMAQRRMSDGSIADNQDYSRRILKVTNA